MEHSHCATTIREPWNKGKLVGQKAPFKLKEIWAIRVRLQLASRHRDLALFNLAIDSKLRACDLSNCASESLPRRHHGISGACAAAEDTTAGAVRDHGADLWRSRCMDPERRTDHRGRTFPSRMRKSAHLSTRQYARIVDSWVEQLGLDRADYGTHMLRRTKATLTTVAPRTFGPFSCCSGTPSWKAQFATLGLRVNDALEMAEQPEV
jgi:hypothetical protein